LQEGVLATELDRITNRTKKNIHGNKVMLDRDLALLLFDLDGTLTGPFPGITRCILYALDMPGRPLPPTRKNLHWCIGPPLKDNFAKLPAIPNFLDKHAYMVSIQLMTYEINPVFYGVKYFQNTCYNQTARLHNLLSIMKTMANRMKVRDAKPLYLLEMISGRFNRF